MEVPCGALNDLLSTRSWVDSMVHYEKIANRGGLKASMREEFHEGPIAKEIQFAKEIS